MKIIIKNEIPNFLLSEELTKKLKEKLPISITSITIEDVDFKIYNPTDKGATRVFCVIDFKNDEMELNQVKLCIKQDSYYWGDKKEYKEAINEYLDAIDNRPNKKGNYHRIKYTPLLQSWTEKAILEGLTINLHYELEEISD